MNRKVIYSAALGLTILLWLSAYLLDRASVGGRDAAEDAPRLEYGALETSSEEISAVSFDVRIRGGNAGEGYGSYGFHMSPLAFGIGSPPTNLPIENSGQFEVVKVGGTELRTTFEAVPTSMLVRDLRDFSSIGLALWEAIERFHLEPVGGEYVVSVIVKTNGVDVARIVVGVPADRNARSTTITDPLVLPNAPYVFHLMTGGMLGDGPIFASAVYKTKKELYEHLPSLGRAMRGTPLLAGPVSLSLYDHQTGVSTTNSKTSLETAKTMLQNHAVAGRFPLSVILAGAGTIGLGGGGVRVEVPKKSE